MSNVSLYASCVRMFFCLACMRNYVRSCIVRLNSDSSCVLFSWIFFYHSLCHLANARMLHLWALLLLFSLSLSHKRFNVIIFYRFECVHYIESTNIFSIVSTRLWYINSIMKYKHPVLHSELGACDAPEQIQKSVLLSLLLDKIEHVFFATAINTNCELLIGSEMELKEKTAKKTFNWVKLHKKLKKCK